MKQKSRILIAALAIALICIVLTLCGAVVLSWYLAPMPFYIGCILAGFSVLIIALIFTGIYYAIKALANWIKQLY